MHPNGWQYEQASEMGSAASKICVAVFYREVLTEVGWSFADPKDAGQGVRQWMIVKSCAALSM